MTMAQRRLEVVEQPPAKLLDFDLEEWAGPTTETGSQHSAARKTPAGNGSSSTALIRSSETSLTCSATTCKYAHGKSSRRHGTVATARGATTNAANRVQPSRLAIFRRRRQILRGHAPGTLPAGPHGLGYGAPWIHGAWRRRHRSTFRRIRRLTFAELHAFASSAPVSLKKWV
jgi:hypothetical protein